jgi:trigger factor
MRAITCEKPKLTLGDYKKAIRELKAGKLKKIWVPGADQKPEDKDKPQKPSLDELLKAAYETVTIELPALLIEHEVNRLLSDLIDQTKKLGMSVEQYLSSTGRTADTIRKEYEDQARRTLTLEFALEDIADKEGILISDDDIDAVLKTAKSDEEKKALQAQRYYVASVLRRQKTIDFLASL